jgi:hypothetical protein
MAPSLQDEMCRFGNRHEVTRHVWVRDGDRTAAFDLLLEDRYRAPRLPRTLPNRTTMKARPNRRAVWRTSSSASRLDAPMIILRRRLPYRSRS